MKKIYQTIFGIPNGNCMQAGIASLIGLDLNEVPNFIEFGNDWFCEIEGFLDNKGYQFVEKCPFLYNPNYCYFSNPTSSCFDKDFRCDKNYSFDTIDKYEGVDGLFVASVLSPKLFTFENFAQHMVVVNKNFDIVHDPNKEYAEIIEYPISKLIGFNGLTDIWNICKK